MVNLHYIEWELLLILETASERQENLSPFVHLIAYKTIEIEMGSDDLNQMSQRSLPIPEKSSNLDSITNGLNV